ncbi:hypothetical protein ABLO27_25085 [Roseibium sp. SCPC15]|uniref:hypothetical protein n=1 Tax=Roseibium sp. SCP15 TaxID=3141376 RepID=UPI003337D2FE
MKIAFHILVVLALTLLSQLGGIAWIVALFFKRRFVVFFISYVFLSFAAVWLAPVTSGRVALSCFERGSLEMQSWIFCALNRNYVSPNVKNVLKDLATATDAAFPGSKTLVLDGNFPFIEGFPLIPHLSHDDGDKVDLALFYRKDSKYLPGATRSPIGYFAFEQGTTECPQEPISLRWDLDVLQPLWRNLELDPKRTRYAVNWLASDPRVSKVFLEPHLKRLLSISGSKVRFQGCRAARHDDHIHFQL